LREPRVVDAHVHFWDPERMHYDWLESVPPLRRAFRPGDIPAGSIRIDGMVVVEADRLPSEALAEVEWASSLSTPSRPVVGIVAAALHSPPADADLAALARAPDVKGVRRLLQDLPAGSCHEPAFVDAVRSLAPWDLVFDLCARHQQLAEAAVLVEQCPEVRFVLDHLGKPRVQPVPDRTWLADITRLAALPNTWCKLSGLTSEVPATIGPRVAPYGPYLDHALQSFGPSRCMFGSDWPVASLTVTYEGWFDQVTAALSGFSSAESMQVMGGTAEHAYRLAPISGPESPAGRAEAEVPAGPARPGRNEDRWH
jgi:L-fuconolactonase